MDDACEVCGHRLTLHFQDENGILRCSVGSCNCSDED